MQNFADYYSSMLARKLFKESREKAAAQTIADSEQDKADHVAAEYLQEDLLQYTVFYNAGCGHQSGEETKGRSRDFLRRWLSFYQPDAAALPQHRVLQQLEEHKAALINKHAKLTAPLLATLLLCVVTAVVLLMLRDSLLLLLIPVVLLALVWLQVRRSVNHSCKVMSHNRTLCHQQTALLERLTARTQHVNARESVLVLQENYTRTLEDFLQQQLAGFVPLTHAELRDQLHAGQLQVFVLESPGILQIPDLCQQTREHLAELGVLNRFGAETWCAQQPYAELEGLTRIHYVFSAIVLEQGVMLCHGFYDWVNNQLFAAGSDYYLWQNIVKVRLFETGFPAENALSDELSDEVYRAQFGEPVRVLSLSIRNGEQYCCALPLRQPLRQTLTPNMPGTLLVRHLKRDVVTLNHKLSMHLQHQYATQPSAAKPASSLAVA